jgi:predicted nucleic acid-binding protein
LSFVIDTSATMPWCFPDEQTPQSEALLDRITREEAHAPALWSLEVVNTLHVAERKGRIQQATADAFIARLLRMAINLDHDSESRAFGEIIKLIRQFQLSAYDASYLELALRLGLPLATRDKDLINAAKACGVELIDA